MSRLHEFTIIAELISILLVIIEQIRDVISNNLLVVVM